VDSSQTGESNQTVRDFACCSRGDDRGLFGTPVLLRRVVSGKSVTAETEERPHGRWIGLLKVSRRGLATFKKVMAELRARPDFDTLDMPTLLNSLTATGAAIEVVYVHGHWHGVNDLEEFRDAVDFAHSQTPFASHD
jgi:phosphoenolpyruvate phosphomutase